MSNSVINKNRRIDCAIFYGVIILKEICNPKSEDKSSEELVHGVTGRGAHEQVMREGFPETKMVKSSLLISAADKGKEGIITDLN